MPDKHYKVTVLKQFCKGCGLCVDLCPQEKLYLEEKPNRKGVQPVAVRDSVNCTGCMNCATICPDAAIEIRAMAEKVAAESKE
jgi:2-oxoglutarate ferredoxin oxidoreductase subunit delta